MPPSLHTLQYQPPPTHLHMPRHYYQPFLTFGPSCCVGWKWMCCGGAALAPCTGALLGLPVAPAIPRRGEWPESVGGLGHQGWGSRLPCWPPSPPVKAESSGALSTWSSERVIWALWWGGDEIWLWLTGYGIFVQEGRHLPLLISSEGVCSHTSLLPMQKVPTS